MDVKGFITANRILLALVMLVPGLLKLFVMGPGAITDMLAGIGFPVAALFAWILILAEVLSGLALLLNKWVEYAAYVPAVILLVAALTVHMSMGSIPNFLLHLAMASNALVFAVQAKE